MSQAKLLFVVGMHRSGTSALCAALHSCGASFGNRLLDPMLGVNDEGFWEDSDVVEINEQLLKWMGASWFTVRHNLAATFDWSASSLSHLREAASSILERGFGDASLQVVKDPRFCVTLPFWLDLCAGLELDSSVCVASRAPIEIAQSLRKRDGFPIGYGLRLYSHYRRLIAQNVPSDSIYVSYDELLRSPEDFMTAIAAHLPLEPREEALALAIRHDLKHQVGEKGDGLLQLADDGTVDFAALDEQINNQYPDEKLAEDLVQLLVERGKELSEKGVEFEASLEKVSSEHLNALATLDERDSQITSLNTRLSDVGTHLSHALLTIPQRDEEIAKVQNQLENLGAEHSYALEVINERDQQVKLLDQLLETRARMFELPVIGRVFRKLWFREES